MNKVIAVILVTTLLGACAGPQHPPVVNGTVYAGTGGTYSRVGISTGNFGINLGF
ncbi:hypothetical protein [Falsihalocynthiibacter arcticus]|uniref:hypothetical protein n=1 Tax=Falsihalocynthiibacter arcticus TaxID=1579316 RepID=UPI0012E894CB|nr:hypothetical protein [Falsihalocynthiibacter arcticus]